MPNGEYRQLGADKSVRDLDWPRLARAMGRPKIPSQSLVNAKPYGHATLDGFVKSASRKLLLVVSTESPPSCPSSLGRRFNLSLYHDPRERTGDLSRAGEAGTSIEQAFKPRGKQTAAPVLCWPQSRDFDCVKMSVEVAMLLGAKFLSCEAFSARQITVHVSAELEVQLPAPPQPGHRSCSKDREIRVRAGHDQNGYQMLHSVQQTPTCASQCETAHGPFRSLGGHRTWLRSSAATVGISALHLFLRGTDKVSAYPNVSIQRQRLVTRAQSAGFPHDPSTFCLADGSLDIGVH
ncbi:hypothetical protein J3F84DRAFT_243964 [Trichoderma pleuroticola]